MKKIFTFTVLLVLSFTTMSFSVKNGAEPGDKELLLSINTVNDISSINSINMMKNSRTPEVYDSLLSRWYEANVVNTYDAFFDEFIDLDSTATLCSDIPDSVYSARLAMIVSPIHIPYNEVVKRYIIRYTTTHKELMRRIMGLSQFYFPLFEQELARQGLPLELRILPIIESALSPVATSRVGASGLWQFMYATGRSYGMEITSFVDQRREPVASTKAACHYLKDLYTLYGDWTLAIAAYNCGPGNINKALKRAGSNANTYWDIYPYLPKETRGYIPSFIAATYAYTFHKQHNIEPLMPPVPMATDTVSVGRLMHLSQVSTTIGTPIETLRALNPQYKLDIIPAVEKNYPLTLPCYDVTRYIESQADIMAKDTLYLAQYLKQSTSSTTLKSIVSEGGSSQSHKVRSGDTLGAIASKYRVTVSQLTKWNHLRTTSTLRIGQIVRIYK